MNKVKTILRFIAGTVLFLWFLTFVLPRIPAVQSFLGDRIGAALSDKLDTEVSIGHVDLRLPVRIVIDDVNILDQQHHDMMRIGRVAASVDIMPLFWGKIRISSAQIFGMKAHITQRDASSPLNCQFVIDSLKSRDTLSHTPLDLSIQSLVVRHGEVTYDRLDMPRPRGVLSPHHLSVTELSTHLMLHHLTDDSLDVSIKRLSLKEQSGLDIRHLSCDILATNGDIHLKNLQLKLPQSDIRSQSSHLKYATNGASGHITSFDCDMGVDGSVTPSDFAFLQNTLKSLHTTVTLTMRAKGTDRKCHADISAKAPSGTMVLDADATMYDILTAMHGDVNIRSLHASETLLADIDRQAAPLPEALLRLGDISIKGHSHIISPTHISGNADIALSKAGSMKLTGTLHDKAVTTHIVTSDLNLTPILGESTINHIGGDITLTTQDINNIRRQTTVRGKVNQLTYNNYTYHNINLDGTLRGDLVSGAIDINDPNVTLRAQGSGDIRRQAVTNATVDIDRLSAKHLHLTDIFGDTQLSAHIRVAPDAIEVTSDIADITMNGNINLATLPQSVMSIVASRMPSIHGLPRNTHTTDRFTIQTNIKDLTFLQRITSLPIQCADSVTLSGFLDATTSTADLTLQTSNMTLYERQLKDAVLHLRAPEGSLQASLSTTFLEEGGPVDISLDMQCRDDHATTVIAWDNRRSNLFRGTVTTHTTLHATPRGTVTLDISIPHSTFEVGDSLWSIQARNIHYEEDNVDIDNFKVEGASQQVTLDGTYTRHGTDSIIATLNDIDVSYILNLADFHSVDFGGYASGRIALSSITDGIKAGGHIDVTDFTFEQGRMGTLSVDATYSNDEGRINIQGICDDPSAYGRTLLSGYVVPSPGEIHLDIEAVNSRMEFMQTFCSSFMKNADLHGTGKVLLYGPFSNINLKGTLVADGEFTLSSTNCRYSLPGDTITFIPDEIMLRDARLYDKFGNVALLTGGIHHKHLTQMSYDINATTSRFLAYDFPTIQGNDTFCGHAIINGDIGIHGKGTELLINADAFPLAGTYLTYNASSPDAIRSDDIITWRSATQRTTQQRPPRSAIAKVLDAGNERTNIRMRFLIHATPNAKLHLIMDEQSGDYIDLFGNGDLQVGYYNKGALDIFGNYTVSHGTYKMTIQNLLRRDFTFQKGGTITFGGDPYDATLQMQALYSLNSVPLADLNIGNTLSANNVPVNCLMNITGTPGKPSVDFDLFLPSLSSDARNMVQSVINSEEEMNQQVLYLLAIGRFYAPSNINNNVMGDERSVSQGTLAMQSFLSGTLSQQFNNVMSGVMSGLLGKAGTLSFGANIAPGAEGFNNAEYEGLLSGRLFNNRLIFNGQFGYRDNIRTNSQSFIGDFSLQYLLTKSGTISLKVYNQSNDRYFTRNSLNTQGIGVVFQKEFGK
ncbi:MAG: translocation/assembly module TamB domain-containing protein [Prevotella sp.]|nr:translocation/assembly module TamB domain-containing protein [Prevotella sp.]